jgi:TIGR02452 family protein
MNDKTDKTTNKTPKKDYKKLIAAHKKRTADAMDDLIKRAVAEADAKLAESHTKRMAATKANLISQSIAKSKIYEFCNKPKYSTPAVFKLMNTDSVSALFNMPDDKHIGVLNFASFKEPGGKFLDGSSAQEECLCHASFLYNVLKKFQKSYYDVNKKNLNKALYLNKTLYTPDIEFSLGSETRFADVINCAAPNWTTANKYYHVSPQENHEALASRIEFVKNIACNNNLDVIVLGAYGCDVFGQDPDTVARLIYHSFKLSGLTVILAVPGKDKNYQAFEKVFA